MKFVVRKNMLDEYDVKLHWETKEKLRSALWTTSWFAVGVVSVGSIIRHDKKKSQDD